MDTSNLTHNRKQTNIQNIFCTFLLGKMELAIPVEIIQEVVNFPDIVNKLPLSPPCLEGVFNLRGMVIPLANMHCLLETKEEVKVSSKVVIIKYRGIKLGLLFDSTNEVLKLKSDDICFFDYANEHKSVVSGALKLDDGKRILQIIDPEALSALDGIPHIVEKLKITGQSDTDSEERKTRIRKQCISFISNGMIMAFEMNGIDEIIKFQKLEPSFINYSYTLGLLNLRGQIIPVIDFGRYLKPHDKNSDNFDNKKILIIKNSTNKKIGLLIDSVEDIISYFENDLKPISQSGFEKKDFFTAYLHKSESEIILLNNLVCMSHPEIEHIVDGHASLFKITDSKRIEKKKLKREVYVSFTLDVEFSLPILEIKEIVNYPEKFMTPPGTKTCITGILNLREKVMSVIDLRHLYGLPVLSDHKSCKIIVAERGNDLFGFVVDSVNHIFSVDSDEKYPVADILTPKTKNLLDFDIKELVLVSDKGTSKQIKIVVLDINSIISRMSA